MAEIISFDGARKRYAAQGAPLQVADAARRKPPTSENQWTETRVLAEFSRYGLSVKQISRRENLSETRVQQIIRANMPPTRRAA